METLKWIGYILLSILGLALVLGAGAAVIGVVFVLAAVASAVLVVFFVAWCIKEYIRTRFK